MVARVVAPSNGQVTRDTFEAPPQLKSAKRINPMTDRFEVSPSSSFTHTSLKSPCSGDLFESSEDEKKPCCTQSCEAGHNIAAFDWLQY